MIKYSTGYVETTSFVNKSNNEEWKGKGSNFHRSSKGRPYKVGNNEYLNRIFTALWIDTKENGLLVGDKLYYFTDISYNRIIKERQMLPDNFYDALYLSNEASSQPLVNPNTGLTVTILENQITNYAFTLTKTYGLQKGGGSAYHTRFDDFPPDWLQERWKKGNEFDKLNRPRYEYNEVHVEGKGNKVEFVLDSYSPGEKIVSRKFTQLSEVKESTANGYLQELSYKYAPGTKITDNQFNSTELHGTTLTGRMYLEVPEQNLQIPQSAIDKANELEITIIDINGKEYN